MEHFSNTLKFLVGENAFLTYAVIYVGTIFLGNILSFSVLWLAFHGSFGTWGIPLLMLVTYAADVSGDLSWYTLGRKLSGTMFGDWIENHLPRHKIVMKYVERNAARLVLLSKFIYSSTFVIIFTVGWSKMEFKKFFKTSLVTITLWIPLMTGIVYGLSSGFDALRVISAFHHLEILFGLGLVAFIALNFLISRIAKKYLGEDDI
jgi:membrane protein DedA with SNARE-associated domain